MTIPNWDFQGSTFISSNYIRLTADHQSQKGALWNNVVSLHNHNNHTCMYVTFNEVKNRGRLLRV